MVEYLPLSYTGYLCYKSWSWRGSDMTELWNVRGVGEKTRRKAKLMAVSKGMTIGAWLENAIERAAELEEIFPKNGGKSLETVANEDGVAGNREAIGAWLATGSDARTAFPMDDTAHLVVEADVGASAPFVRIIHGESPGSKPELPRPMREPKRCGHGIRQGVNCWQCGGLAVIEP